ncbi:hypothetical protein GP486_008916, partial [Trichoglossum hirsutum]
MAVFIAGATTILFGTRPSWYSPVVSHARTTDERRLSESPATIFAIVFADSGAMTIRSDLKWISVLKRTKIKKDQKPAPQLNVQDPAASAPRAIPLVFVVVHAVDVGKEVQGLCRRLFPALAVEEPLGRLGEEDPDREVPVVGERLDDVGQLDRRDGPAGAEQK